MNIYVKIRMSLKRIVWLNILLFSTLIARADFGGKVKNALSKEFNSLTGIYITGGLVAAGLLVYVISNYVFKEKPDNKSSNDAIHNSQHNHLRHRHRHSHKKTS